MVEHRENCDFPCIITLENHLKCTCLNTNIVLLNENMILGLFYDALSTSVVM
jgi:hypothetical protein